MKKLLYIFSVLLVVITACEHKQYSVEKLIEVDSIVHHVSMEPNLGKALTLTDSFENIGRISFIHASKLRGESYLQVDSVANAEVEFKKGSEGIPQTAIDSFYWFFCSCALVQYEDLRRDHDAVLRKALPLMETMKNMAYPEEYEIEMQLQKLMLFLSVGTSELFLEKINDADKPYEQAYVAAQKMTELQSSFGALYNATMGMHNIANSYLNLQLYDKAELWLTRADRFFEKMYDHPDTPAEYKTIVKAYIDYDHALLAFGQNKPDVAEKYFKEVIESDYSKSAQIRHRIVSYLIKTKRYAEAADLYQALNDIIAKYKIEPSVDMIGFVRDKFIANYMSGRKDSALAAAMFALDYVDSALVRQKRSEATKFATIYETQQKDEEIARQQINLNRQRFLALAVALVLITVFFIIYTLFRRRAAKRMAEMKAAQERIESELRIARDIQMSMVPSTFPEYDGLDLYASMTPAKEVGGDLYGYVINGHNLYFAVGDVSGKGVPASLFMAQATRLFHTMANQGLMPAEICNHMNVELSGEDNVNGMFVTMFIGMLNMENGHLNYCNAGHNPPVIGGGKNHGNFLQMESNAPIGLFPDLEYEGEEMESIKGRALFIYTDGLNEAEDPEQSQFGDERLLEILRDTHFDSAKQVVETLFAKVEEHRSGADPNDDLTMLCLRVN